jgi:hypothetical protein
LLRCPIVLLVLHADCARHLVKEIAAHKHHLQDAAQVITGHWLLMIEVQTGILLGAAADGLLSQLAKAVWGHGASLLSLALARGGDQAALDCRCNP